MNSFGHFVVIFALMLFVNSVNAIECLRGLKTALGDNDPFENIECPDKSYICYRMDALMTTDDGRSSKNATFFKFYVT